MKTLLQKLVIIATFVSICFTNQQLKAQCAAGFTNAKINFDMHYFVPYNLPANPLNFAIGKNSMQFRWTGTNTFRGNTAEHTGQASSLATGDDLKYVVGSGADTLTFEKEVSNLRFSVYDIDLQQRMVVTAQNAAGLPVNITTLQRASGTTLTIVGSGTAVATATSSSTAVALTATNGTANITIAGPVKKVILTFTKIGGAATDSIYISDIAVCNNNTTTGVFATGYQSISTPEPGQPQYVLASFNDSIVAVDQTNNIVDLLYEVPGMLGTTPSINSLAYDPVNQMVYYTDNIRSTTNIAVYRYDVKTGVNSIWIPDIRTFGVQLFFNGLGSGAASFYDGALYLGQDMSAATSGVINPETVYRVEIDSVTGDPIKATRVWSKMGYTGFATLFDWSDFVVNNGVFYNFNNSTTPAANTSILHINLNTDSTTNGYTLGTPLSQASIDYSGNIYHMWQRNDTAYYYLYNGAGGFGAPTRYTGTSNISITDAAESFKYPYDYGDAPTSYGTTFHLYRVTQTLKIGSLIDFEQTTLANSTADGDDVKNTGASNDEDGVTSFPIITTANASYTVPITVTNSSGSAATLYGYLDFNRDGDFGDAGEQSASVAVANGTTTSTPLNVTWTGLTGGVVGASFIRFRLANNAAESANRFGFARTGEVEDYPFPINASSLPVELVEFKATANENNTTLLEWSTASELNNDFFEIQRSQNNIWETIGNVDGNGNSNHLINYSFTDNTPYEGINYYRLKQVDFNGHNDFSPVVSVKFNEIVKESKDNIFELYPNPARNAIWIKTAQNNSNKEDIEMDIYNLFGEKIYTSNVKENEYKVDLSNYQPGVYFIKIANKTFKIMKE